MLKEIYQLEKCEHAFPSLRGASGAPVRRSLGVGVKQRSNPFISIAWRRKASSSELTVDDAIHFGDRSTAYL